MSLRLVVVCGLPGAGKSALAEAVARRLGAASVSVDPLEAAMWTAGIARTQPTGLAAYVVAEAVAEQVLACGADVVLDAVNDVEPARGQWRGLAARTGAALTFVEVRCSDPGLHRARLEGRVRDIPGFPEPTWTSVEARRGGFEGWADDRVVVDSVRPLADGVDAVLAVL